MNTHERTWIKAAPAIGSQNTGVLDVLGAPFSGPINGGDVHGERFTPATNFREDLIPEPPVIYFHGRDAQGQPQSPVVLGKVVKRWADKVGHWFKVQLDLAKPEAKRIWEAAQKGKAAASTGVVPAFKRVTKSGDITEWLIGELSLIDIGDKRRPANAYAVATPSMKAAFDAAGIQMSDEVRAALPGNQPAGTVQIFPGVGYQQPSLDPLGDSTYAYDGIFVQRSIQKMSNTIQNVLTGLLGVFYKSQGIPDDKAALMIKAAVDVPETLGEAAHYQFNQDLTGSGVVTPALANAEHARHDKLRSEVAAMNAAAMATITPNTQSLNENATVSVGQPRVTGSDVGVHTVADSTALDSVTAKYGAGTVMGVGAAAPAQPEASLPSVFKAQMDEAFGRVQALEAELALTKATQWVDSQVAAGRVAPAEIPAHVTLYRSLTASDRLMKSAEGAGTLDVWKTTIESRQPIVSMQAAQQALRAVSFTKSAPVGGSGEQEISEERRAELLGQTEVGKLAAKRAKA